MANQISREMALRSGEPNIRSAMGVSHGTHYICFGDRGYYLHKDLTIWDMCCDDQNNYKGWYGSFEEAQEMLEKFNRKDDVQMKTISGVECKLVGMVKAQSFFHANLNEMGNCTKTIYVWDKEADHLVTTAIGLSPMGWGTHYDFYIPASQFEEINSDIKFRTINSTVFKAIDVEEAQKYYDHVLHESQEFREAMYCSTTGYDGIITRVYNLEPKHWGEPTSHVVFFVPEDLDLDNLKTTKKIFLHHSVVQAFNLSDYLQYWGDNKYYKRDVKNTFNSDENNPIKVNNNGDIECRGNVLRVGRVLQQVNKNLDSTQIEKMVSDYKAKYTVDTSRVETSDNIGEVYDISECGGSCMAHKPWGWFTIYEDAGSFMAYIRDKSSGNLLARALVHHVVGIDTGNEYTVLDRVFFEREIYKITMKKWAEEQGYTRMSRIDERVRTKNSISSSYDNVPYIDTLCFASYFNGTMYLTNSDSGYEDLLQNTDGGSEEGYLASGEDRVWCDDEDRYVHIDDAFYCETDGEYYASEYHLCYISGHGYYREDDDDVAYDEHTKEWAFRNDLKYCESRDFYTSDEDYVDIGRGRNEGSYEYFEDTVYCDDICENVMSDEATYITDLDIWVWNESEYYEHSDGNWYSEPENEEDEEVA